MKDYLQECQQDFGNKQKKLGLNPVTNVSEFQGLFCSACRNAECIHHQLSNPFSRRVSTQAERLTRPVQADPHLPKYADIMAKDFANLLQEAMRLEVSSRVGDWTVPETPAPVKVTPKTVPSEDSFEETLKEAFGGIEEISLPEETPLEEPKQPTVAPSHPKKPLTGTPRKGNALPQNGMLGEELPPPVRDPWDASPEGASLGGRRVKFGATIRFNESGEVDE